MANEKPSKKQHKYTVTSVMDRTIPDGTRGFKSVMEVSYQSERGTMGSVKIDTNKATPEAVADAINVDIERIEQIFSLGQ